MARKPTFGVPAVKSVRVRLTEAQRTDLDLVVRQNGAGSLSEVIRDAVNEYVADFRERTCFVVQNPNHSRE